MTTTKRTPGGGNDAARGNAASKGWATRRAREAEHESKLEARRERDQTRRAEQREAERQKTEETKGGRIRAPARGGAEGAPPVAPPSPPAQRPAGPTSWDIAAHHAKAKQAIEADRQARADERRDRLERERAAASPAPRSLHRRKGETDHAWRVRRGAEKGLSRSQATGKPKQGESSASFFRELGRAAHETAGMGSGPHRNEQTRMIVDALSHIGAISPNLTVQQQAKQFAEFWDDMGWGDIADAYELFWDLYEEG